MKYKLLLLLICMAALPGKSIAQYGYNIRLDMPSDKNKTVYLAKYWDSKPYIQDSTIVSDAGKATLSSREDLPDGQYLIYIKPDTQLDLLLSGRKNDIDIYYDSKNAHKASIKGSQDTKLLWQYALKINDLSNVQADNEKTKSYTSKTISDNKNSWFGAYLKGMQSVSPPYPDPKNGNEADSNRLYIKQHYFDNIDLTDIRFWRTSYLPQLLDDYMTVIIGNDPDSLAAAASELVSKTEANTPCFEQMLSRFVNNSSLSNIMGKENIWARLYEDYIKDKDVAWIDELKRADLEAQYARIEHNRVGMTAQNITMQAMNGDSVSLNDIDAEWTILYFYNPTCGHCATEMPLIHDKLYPKYKDHGLKIIAFNTNTDRETWTNFVDKHKLYDLINCDDAAYKSKFWMYYDVSGTPMTYLMDKNKKIIAKKVSYENLDSILDFYTKKSSEKE